MEYPPRENKTWTVLAFDVNGQAMFKAEHLTQEEAQDLADKWIARNDVGSVQGKEVEERGWIG